MQKWVEPAKYFQSLPKKRMGAGVIILDGKGRILLVKPSYRTDWGIPGGVVEANESPRQTVIRETEEEVGLKLPELRLLVVDYKFPSDNEDENLQWIFYGGKVSEREKLAIRLRDGELTAWEFVPEAEAAKRLGEKNRRRLPFCRRAIDEGRVFYLEDQEEVGGD